VGSAGLSCIVSGELVLRNRFRPCLARWFFSYAQPHRSKSKTLGGIATRNPALSRSEYHTIRCPSLFSASVWYPPSRPSLPVVAHQFDLSEQIDGSYDRVQQTRERGVEESQSEILRRGGSHEPFDRPVATFDFPAVAVLRDVSAPPIRHEHRILPVIVVFRVLFPAVD